MKNGLKLLERYCADDPTMRGPSRSHNLDHKAAGLDSTVDSVEDYMRNVLQCKGTNKERVAMALDLAAFQAVDQARIFGLERARRRDREYNNVYNHGLPQAPFPTTVPDDDICCAGMDCCRPRTKWLVEDHPVVTCSLYAHTHTHTHTHTHSAFTRAHTYIYIYIHIYIYI